MAGTNSLSEPYTSAILLATFSLLVVILILPPMLWHLSNRKIGATSLILWLLILNFQDFLNAVLWPHDNIFQWFDGNVLCDIEVKIMVAATVGVPSSVACVLRALAKVMDTERASLGLTKAQRRRGYAVDLLWCAGFPVLQMFFHYIVQTERYYVVGISGCTPAVSSSWVADLLIISPPVAWALVGGYYSGKWFWNIFHVYRDCQLNLPQHLFSSAFIAIAATSPHFSPTATRAGHASSASSPSAWSGSRSLFRYKSM